MKEITSVKVEVKRKKRFVEPFFEPLFASPVEQLNASELAEKRNAIYGCSG
jgi:hypothetical protein